MAGSSHRIGMTPAMSACDTSISASALLARTFEAISDSGPKSADVLSHRLGGKVIAFHAIAQIGGDGLAAMRFGIGEMQHLFDVQPFLPLARGGDA